MSAVKRKRDEDDAAGAGDDDDDAPLIANTKASKNAVVKGEDCPYLDTISRQNLDFDFEKCCSVSLSHVNVYACLVCGKYFQGRGPGTHAHTHSVEEGHQIFMKLDSGLVYCLPDNYRVEDHTLSDIRHVLSPTYSRADIAALRDVTWARTLDGQDYMPGLVGLNNMKANDYANVVIQALARVRQLRDFFLWPQNYSACKSPLVQRFGELMRKLWNTRAFKGQVSPHEFMQAVIEASEKRFTIDSPADPVAFWAWLLNALHRGLAGDSRKARSIITKCFQGKLEVTTLAGTGKAADSDTDVVDRVPFLQLAVDLPPARLFQDVMEKNIIPQVPIYEILQKYDGDRVHDDIKAGRRRFRVLALPPYLMIAITRFTRNRFFTEKNPTIVNFPVRNLDLKDCIPVPAADGGAAVESKYNLIATVSHLGEGPQGTYKAYVHRAAEKQWYDVQDLLIQETIPDSVAISEAYLQVYERHSRAQA